MIDVSASLFNALPAAYGSSRLSSSRSLLTSDSQLEGGDSLRAIASSLRREIGIADFSPPPANQQGFASLGPTLSTLRLSPEQLAPSTDLKDEPATYEKLLQIQDEISQRRTELEEAAELRDQARRQAAAELEISEARARAFREKAVYSSERPIPAEQLSDSSQQQQNSAEPAPLLGQNDSVQNLSDAGQTIQLYPPDTAPPGLYASEVPEAAESNIQENNNSPIVQRQRIQQLFNTEQNPQNSGNNISVFA